MKAQPNLFLLLSLACALIASACFIPGLGGGFVFDDGESIVRNQAIKISALTPENLAYAAYSFQPGHGSRALAMLSFALDYWIGGLNPRAFKTTNILIHVVTFVALTFFLRQLLLKAAWQERQAEMGAIVLAAVWATHPLQVSSVLYVVQRMQTLVTLFMVLALWSYLRMRVAQQQGQKSRVFAILTIFFAVLGLASKEDALLFPLYTLVLEMTVLHFYAASPRLEAFWRKTYLLFVAIGVLAGVMLFARYWHWDDYPSRDFSSLERLMTQGRVLMLYLRQILLPLPDSMHFYYDDFVVSRGWLNPVSTVLAWSTLTALLIWAYSWRTVRPLFSFGVLLFFAGHAITSSVLNLEMVFEHRNHLPLIGVVLAVADLSLLVWRRMGWQPRAAIPIIACVLIGMASITTLRAHIWGEPERFAIHTLRVAPMSERAWVNLGAVYVDKSAFKPGPWLNRAIEINSAGAKKTGSAIMLSNVVIYKTLRGDATRADWLRLEERLKHVTMNAQNRGIALNTLSNAERGIPLEQEGILRVFEIEAERARLTANDNLRMAAYINNRTDQPERALPFLRRAVDLSEADDPDIARMFSDLNTIGRPDWVRELQARQRNR